MDPRLSILTLGVSDLPRATKFYQDTLGWTKTKSSNDEISFFHLNGMLLALFENEKLAEDAGLPHVAQPGFRGFTMAYNCRSREEVNSVFSFLKTKGVPIVKEPQDVFWGGYSGGFQDPDGNY